MLRLALPLPAVRALVALTPLRYPSIATGSTTTPLLVTRTICTRGRSSILLASTSLHAAQQFKLQCSSGRGRQSQRLSSSPAFSSSFGSTEDEILHFMRWNHELSHGQPPTDHDMLHWKPSIHATLETSQREGKPGGFIHYIAGGEIIAPANGSIISEDHVLMLQVSQELLMRGDDGMAGILQANVTRAVELDGSLGMVWMFLWNGNPDAEAMGRAAKMRGITKELKFAVQVENPGTPAEVVTLTGIHGVE